MSSPFLTIHNELRLAGNDMALSNLLLLSDALKHTGLTETQLNRIADKNKASFVLPYTTTKVFFKDKLPPFAPKRITYATN